MEGEQGSNTSDDKLKWIQSTMHKYLGEDDYSDNINEDQLPEPQNVRAFSLRTGRDNFESPAWNQPPTQATNNAFVSPSPSSKSNGGEWVGFIPSQTSFLGGHEQGTDQTAAKKTFSQQPVSTILNVLISSSILKEPPTQLDLRKIASEFGNSFSGVCSISDLKVYIVSLSTDARNIQASRGRWGDYDNDDLVERLTVDELVIESLSKKGVPLYDHEVLFDPERGVVTNDLSIKRVSDKHREAAENRFGAISSSAALAANMIDYEERSCEEAFHAALEKFDNADTNADPIESFLWDSIQECLHRFQLIERSQPHLAPATAAQALGIELDKSLFTDEETGKTISAELVVGKLAGILVDEHASWKLLQHLYFHNLIDSNVEPSSEKLKSDIDLTDKEVVRQLLTKESEDEELRQLYPDLPERSIHCDADLLRVVVCKRWLEECFRVTADFYGYARSPGDLRKESRWSWSQEGLERALKFGRTAASTSTATMSELAHLDPDATFRNNAGFSNVDGNSSGFLKLAVLDSEDERDLLLDVWRFIRSGDLQSAIDQCSSRFSHWRAATLAGGDLHGYQNSPFSEDTRLADRRSQNDPTEAFKALIELGILREHASSDDQYVNEEGNPSRSVWLNTCWDTGRMFSSDSYGENADTSNTMSGAGVDKALYAIEGSVLASLSGDCATLLKSPLILKSGREWEDKCWSLLKAMEVCGIQSVLAEHHQRQFQDSSLYPTSQDCIDPLSHQFAITTEGCDEDEVDHLSAVKEALVLSMDTLSNYRKGMSTNQRFLQNQTAVIAPTATKQLNESDVVKRAGDLFHSMGWRDVRSGEVHSHHQVQVAAVMGSEALEALFMKDKKPTSQVKQQQQPVAFSFGTDTTNASPFTFGGGGSDAAATGTRGGMSSLNATSNGGVLEMPLLDVHEYSDSFQKRFACHFAIILRSLNVLKCEESLDRSDDIICIYVHHLIDKSYMRLVALYCKFILNDGKRISCYVKLMSGIQDRSDREACIELAFKYFPSDVEVITRLVVENIRNLPTPQNGGNDNQLAITNGGGDAASYFVSPKQTKKSKFNPPPLSASGNRDDAATQQLTLPALSQHFQPVMSTLSNDDVTKIKSIEWLCISDEHKAEAVAQANELLREFFNSSTSRTGSVQDQQDGDRSSQGWRIDAAELLVQSTRGINDTNPPLAFPTQVLSRISEFYAKGSPVPVLLGGRSSTEWARVLKEHQCWRTLLHAHQCFMSWHSCLARLQSDKPPLKQTPALRQGASQEEIEEHMYMARRDVVKNTQLMGQWLTEKVGEMEKELNQACFALNLVLEFEATEECYGPCFGEIDYHGDVSDMVNVVSQCGMDPDGWMVFSQDRLVSEETLQNLDVEESSQDNQTKLEKTRNGTELTQEEISYFQSRSRNRDQRHMDRAASQTIRREVIPKLLLMLHEVYFSTSDWLLRVGEISIKAFSNGSLAPQAQQLQSLAIKHLQSSLQVSDLAASRELGYYTCMDKQQLRRFLAAMHSSAMKICELKGEVTLETEE